MRRPGARLLAAALALVVLAGVLASGLAQQPAKPAAAPTAEDWDAALRIVREIALDTARPAEQRANAVTAYARMQLARGRPAEATKTCWDVFDNPKDQAVAVAAARAAGLVARHGAGHLGAPRRLAAEWARKARGPASKRAIATVGNDYTRMAGYLMGLARKRPTPPPIRVAVPPWGRPAPKSGPAVLRVALPTVAAPPWLKMQPGQGLRMFQVPVPVVKPDRCIAADKQGVPKALQLALPVYSPPPLMARDKARRPKALVLTIPEYTPPAWYRRVTFPRLKEPKK
jgi:hypothetical protein